MEELTYEELMRIYAREKGSKLSAIPSNFYKLAGKLLLSYDKSDPSGMREYNNALKMIKFIYQRRLEKILNHIISHGKEEIPPEMLDREKEVCNQIAELIEKFSNEIDKELLCPENNCESSNLTAISEPIVREKKNQIKVLIIKDVEEFVGANGSVIGPFKQNSEVELLIDDAIMLIQIGVAKKIE
ncbi:MAG: hypothetical protein NZ903_01115 [Candidatus Micrarchaeota archaeon]|nr:hypothetical protein [Candidatus Micrarchaeota archaeon]